MNNKPENEDKLTLPAKKEKQVLTIYFDVDLVDSIDDFIHFAKKEMPAYKKRRLSRTSFMQLILNEAIEDYKRFKNESFLWQLILSSKDS